MFQAFNEITALLIRYNLDFKSIAELPEKVSQDTEADPDSLILLSRMPDFDIDLLKNPSLPREAALNVFERFKKLLEIDTKQDKFFGTFDKYFLPLGNFIDLYADELFEIVSNHFKDTYHHNPFVDKTWIDQYWRPKQDAPPVPRSFAHFLISRFGAEGFVGLICKYPGFIRCFLELSEEDIRTVFKVLKKQSNYEIAYALSFPNCPRDVVKQVLSKCSAKNLLSLRDHGNIRALSPEEQENLALLS